MCDSDSNQPVTIIPGRKPSERESFLLKAAHEEVVKRIDRIEGAAKVLTGAVGAVISLFVGAQKLLGAQANPSPQIHWAVLLLCGALLFSVLVHLPLRYKFKEGVPASIEECFSLIGLVKWGLLMAGALFFCAGVFLLLYAG